MMKHTNRTFAFLLGMLLCAMPLAAMAETEVTLDAVALQETELLTDGIEAELPGELELPPLESEALELPPLELQSLELTETEPSAGTDDAAEPAQEHICANSDAGDFEIEDGVLRAYRGKGGEVVIPKSVTIIGAYVFAACI